MLNRETCISLKECPGKTWSKSCLNIRDTPGNIEEVSDNDSEKLDYIAHQIHERKKRIFEQINASAPIKGAEELVSSLRCKKAVVSGCAKQEVHSFINKYFGKDAFDVIVTGEDLEEGKPSPDPFRTALVKMGLTETEAIVVENAPLGVKGANNAGIRCIVTLNNTPLKISDFDGLIAQESIFPNTGAASSFLKEYCESITSD